MYNVIGIQWSAYIRFNTNDCAIFLVFRTHFRLIISFKSTRTELEPFIYIETSGVIMFKLFSINQTSRLLPPHNLKTLNIPSTYWGSSMHYNAKTKTNSNVLPMIWYSQDSPLNGFMVLGRRISNVLDYCKNRDFQRPRISIGWYLYFSSM